LAERPEWPAETERAAAERATELGPAEATPAATTVPAATAVPAVPAMAFPARTVVLGILGVTG